MNANQQPTLKYSVDIVYCIDCTGSMGPYLESYKDTALNFYQELQGEMERIHKGISQLRVKVVIFRDLGEEKDEAIQETPFFTLPDGAPSFKEAVASLEPFGGGDEPESALEALAVALRSDWERNLDRRRHVVVMCTDASAHPLGKFEMTGTTQSTKPFPTSMEELQAIWGDEADDGEMEYEAKRLLIFGPRSYPWEDATGLFENCIYVPTEARAGMSDQDQRQVISAIAGSV